MGGSGLRIACRFVLLAALAMLAGSAEAQLPRPLSARPGAAASAPSFALTGAAARPTSSIRTRTFQNPHGNIAIACEACHTSDGWRPLRDDPDFEHRRDTGYELEARHAQAACQSCHLGLRFTGMEGLGADCGSCHVDIHRGALGDACQSCHEPTDWALVDGVEVHAQTAFPLTGSHLQVSCESCHTAGSEAAAFSPLPSDCLGCHQDDLQSTEASLVPHVSSGFPADCQTCHHTAAWSAGPFDHAGVSGGFTLVGAHEPLACSSCHAVGPDFASLFEASGPNDCIACHDADQASATVDHSGFPTTCTECHSIQTWQGATADHVLLSGGFALVGSHLDLDCSSCHLPDLTPIWDPASQGDCIACHEADYQSTANGIVDHVAGGFPTTCTECHGVDEWQSASFDHTSASGGFSLVGAHEAISCASCHSGPGGSLPWEPASQNDCVSCHAEDAAAATPAHDAFPETCTTCHGIEQWPSATADHVALSGGFALVGAHMALDCATCHSGPGGALPWDPATQDDCVSCHQADRDAAQPDHTGFPTTCTDCHTANQWQGAQIDHPQFPIFSGRHAGEWDTCQTCHVQPSDFQVFSCLTCHEHNRTDTDDHHDEVNGYVYESSACYSCHPDGRADDLR